FADDDNVRTAGEILLGVIRRLGAAEDDQRASLLTGGKHFQHVELGHHVDVETDDWRALRLEQRDKFRFGAEGGIEYTHGEAARLEIGREVQYPQGRIRLHDLQFVRVFVQEVPMCK